ncbi:MAG: Soluble lytic murein transglycosylase [Bradyrhizobium sp.]|nr:Soluble lytic murein transglycosylase [Bradyrhizobium sp.]
MSDVRWDMLAQYPNAGANFAQAFQQGLQRNEQQAGKNALATMVTNPNDPQAFSRAAKYDPAAAMQLQQQQRKFTDDEHQQWNKYAGELAKWATDPAKWDQAVGYLVQSGHPEAAKLKGQFSPAMRAHFMAQAGIQDDSADPGVAKDVAYYKSIGRDDLAQAVLLNHANPQQPIQTANPDGTIQVNWVRPPLPGGQGAQQGPASTPTVSDQATYDAVPPGTPYTTPDGHTRMKPGGQSPQGSGGFR